jgi:hypothetical protein
MSTSASDEEQIEEIRAWFHEQGYYLLGPHQPGASNPELSQEDRDRIGWFTPYVRHGSTGGSGPYGWGRTPLGAAQSAQRMLVEDLAGR